MKQTILTTLLSLLLFTSCKKDWLDAKPQKSLVVPKTIANFQALMDNETVMNGFGGAGMPTLGELNSDDYYAADNTIKTVSSAIERNSYIWNKDIYEGTAVVGDWNGPYAQVFNANIVLEGISKITPSASETNAWNNVKGSALFFRAHAFFALAQIFAKPYSAAANTDLGIPLKLSPEIGNITRATLQATYDQIISDLNESLQYLPNTPDFKTRPSKAAAYGLLARLYLTIGQYDKALTNADASLNLNSTIIDYNTLNATSAIPFTPFNDEVIFTSNLVSYLTFIMSLNYVYVDNTLYGSYDANDLRKALYFKTISANTYGFKGSFNATYSGNFCGIATDELYLIKSECFARSNNTTAALTALNILLQKRYKTGTFQQVTAATADEALLKILNERRKELLFRGLRWLDLRRLNTDPRFAKTLTRTYAGVTYTLPPNDPKYVFEIPVNELIMNDMPQNIR